MINLDLYIFNSINGFAGKWVWLDYLGMFFAQKLEYLLWLLLGLILLINAKKYWKMIIEAVIAAGLSKFVFAEIIRMIWFRPRPFVVFNFLPLVNQSAKEASFPSGHASFYFALSTIVYLYNKKIGSVFYVISALIVLARIFVGVHWPSDILAGIILGTIVAWLTHKIINRYIYNWIRNFKKTAN